MATVSSYKGEPKAFQANSKAKANAIVDRKAAEGATKVKAAPENRGTREAAPARQAPNAPQVARQATEAVANKGGRVDRKA
jgi:hypothetical protein